MELEERKIIEILDAAINQIGVKELIDDIVTKVEQNLENDHSSIMAWEPIPLDIYKTEIPGGIKSSWVFVLRKNIITGAERHPNSIQRMMSYKGTGDFQTKPDELWDSNFLQNDIDANIEKRWISIPINVWHQAVVGNENWAVVSFQTAEASELIEERPDESNDNAIHRKKYLD